MRVALLCPVQPEPARRCPGPGRRSGRRARRGRSRRRGARPRPTTTVDVPGLAPGRARPAGSLARALPANGSVAPVALGPGRGRRAVRAVRDRAASTSCTSTSRWRPAPATPAWWRAALPKVGTFHRAGSSVAYRVLGPVARAPGAAAWRRAVRCRPRRRATAADALGRHLRDHRQRHRPRALRHGEPSPDHGPDGAVRGAPRGAQGTGGAARRGVAPRAPGPRPCGWRGRAPRPRGCAGGIPAATGSCGWAGSTTTSWRRASPGAARAVCAGARGESFGVVLLEAMAARAAVVASDIPGYGRWWRGHGLLVAPGDVGRLGARPSRPWRPTPRRARGCVRPAALDAAFAHASQWSMPEVAERYLAVYERVVAESRSAR